MARWLCQAGGLPRGGLLLAQAGGRGPPVTEQRVWTNHEDRKLTATVKAVKDGKGQFVAPGGKVFVLEISQLCADDQAFLKKAIEEHAAALRQLQFDYPWLKLE